MKPIIPLFFAVNDNFAKYLKVTLESIFENASKDYAYDVVILNIGLKEETKKMLNKYKSKNVKIIFYDVRYKLQKIAQDLSIKDYYNKATYYRLFVADLFPQYNKALYLDSDIVVLGDISKLYNHELKSNLVGAIPHPVLQHTHEFSEYVNKVLGIKDEHYYNAGVLLMNFEGFRYENIEEKFLDLLSKYTYDVGEDQDYLNVLTKNRVLYIDDSWNVMPLGEYVKPINLIHYNLSLKPWKYDNIQYEEYFWEYAKKAGVENEILEAKNSFSLQDQKNDHKFINNLKQKAVKQSSKGNWFTNLFKRNKSISHN